MVRVLIVDDDKDFLKTTGRYLQGQGHEVHTLSTGEGCLERIKDIIPDLVLLDVMMPGISGWDVCRTIKDDPDTGHIPVIILTARDSMADFQRSMAYARADSYLSKPIRHSWLDVVIERFSSKE